MNNSVVANVLVTLVAAILAIAAYLSAKHYFDFEQQSFKQFAAIGVGLFGLLGPILLQHAILVAFVPSSENEYLRRLTLVQFVIALLVFIWKLKKNMQRKRHESGGNAAIAVIQSKLGLVL